ERDRGLAELLGLRERMQLRHLRLEAVGLHHASPPPSNCGYCPAWISCENDGTWRSIVFVIVVELGTYGFELIGSDATAPSRVTVGDALEPGARKNVTRSWYDVSGWSFAKK